MTLNIQNIVICAGFGASGSSALLDMLKEVETYLVESNEFRMFSDPDGLLSLESAFLDNWSVYQGDMAIRRFRKMAHNLSKKYRSPYSGLSHSSAFGDDFEKIVDGFINKLISCTYKGFWYGIDNLAQRLLNKFRILRRNIITTKIMSATRSLDEREFLDLTREFLLNLIKKRLQEEGKQNFAFNEGFASMNPCKILRYLPSRGKIIVVMRDPRDICADIRMSRYMFAPRTIPEYVKYQTSIFNRWEDISKHINKDKVMLIRFEDLVLDYEQTAAKIFHFLQIDPSHHTRVKEVFNPAVSKKNIGLWEKMLNYDEQNYIQVKLKPFLQKYKYMV